MIYVSKDHVVIPPKLMMEAERDTRKLMQQIATLGPQQRVEFKSNINHPFKDLLLQLFHNKCAYCERNIEKHDAHLELFRPKAVYPWLAYQWDNMLVACATCNAAYKADRFPLKKGQMPATNDEELKAEMPMLLNPCVDRPEEHLAFGDSGKVRALSPRGEVTIRELGLNRETLISRRLAKAQGVHAQYLGLVGTSAPGSAAFKKGLSEITAPHVEFSAVARAVVGGFPQGGAAAAAVPGIEALVRKTPSAKIKKAFKSVVPEHAGYIEEIEVQAFRSLETVRLKFDWAAEVAHAKPEPQPPPDEVPTLALTQVRWQMLLGENGVGKSSLLQALALAVAGEEAQKERAIGDFCRPERILRRAPQGGRGKTEGLIRLKTSKGEKPVEIRFDKKGMRYVTGAKGVHAFLRGYGATRLPPNSQVPAAAAEAETPGLAIANLFNPFQPLCDVDAWLRGLSVAEFDKVAMTLKDVLQVRNSQNIVLYQKGRDIGARDANGTEVEISALSQGQRATLMLTCDLLAGIMKQREAQGEEALPGGIADFQSAEGIVLLDEIDAHLHPRWKMEIVPSLKRAFPRIQFICATHEPLCLRGLGAGEIVLMTKVDEVVKAEVTPESPRGMRIDQILTSRLFGLHSTIDPELDAMFAEYYHLLALPESGRSKEDKARVAALKQEVQKHNRLGHTRRDQLVYEVIDKCLAKEALEADAGRRQKLRETTKRRVRNIWARVENSMRGNEP